MKLQISALLTLSAAACAKGDGGSTVPEIKADGFLNAPSPITIAQSKGKVVALEFWATW